MVQGDVASAIAAHQQGDAKAKRKALERYVTRTIQGGAATDDDVVLALDLIDDPALPVWVPQSILRVAWHGASAFPRAHARYLEMQAGQQQDAEALKRAKVEENRRAARERLLISTTQQIPGREIEEILGLVAGHAVMSRNAVSDLGSNFSSAVGGRLGGIEKAVESARREATRRLTEAAEELGAHAVVAVDTSVQTVADKAQLVMMVGTAVVLASPAAPSATAAV